MLAICLTDKNELLSNETNVVDLVKFVLHEQTTRTKETKKKGRHSEKDVQCKIVSHVG